MTKAGKKRGWEGERLFVGGRERKNTDAIEKKKKTKGSDYGNKKQSHQ